MTEPLHPSPLEPAASLLHGARGRPEELASRFGVKLRLGVRIGALAAKGLGVTATVLEVAAEDPDLANFLQLGQLLDAAPDRPRLDGLLAEHGGAMSRRADAPVAGASPSLAIANDSAGGLLLCLEEEVLAATAWASGSALSPLADLGSALVTQARVDAASQIDAGEIPSLERAFRTASDAGRRVEALTTLVTLAPLDRNARAGLLVEAMGSRSADVARAAIGLLVPAGLPRALAAALEDLEAPALPLRMHAVDRLRTALAGAEADPLCLAAVLLVVRRVLTTELEPGARRQLVLLLGEATRGAVATAPNIQEVVRTLVAVSLDAPAAMSLTVRRAVLRLGAEAPVETAAALWAEARALGDDDVAVYILALLGELPLPEDIEEQFCSELVRRVFARAESPNLAQLEIGLRRRAERGLAHLVPMLAAAAAVASPDVVTIIDRLAAIADVSAGARARARLALIYHLERASPACAAQILESRLMSIAGLESNEAVSIARELVTRLELYFLADVWQNCLETFGRLGRHALAPLLERLSDPRAELELARRALALLARTFAAQGETSYDPESRGVARDFLVEALEQASVGTEQGQDGGAASGLRLSLADAAGALLASANTPHEEMLPAMSAFLAALVGRAVPGERAWPRFEESPRSAAVWPELMHLFAAVVGRDDLGAALEGQLERGFKLSLGPQAFEDELLVAAPAEDRAWTGRVFQSTGGEAHYTVVIPDAIDGLALLATRTGDGRVFRRRYMLLNAAWERLLAGEVWGPVATTLLLRRLAELAACEAAPAGVRKLFLETLAVPAHLLLPDEGELPLVSAVAEVLERSSAAVQRAHGVRILSQLLTARREGLGFKESERSTLLRSLCRVAALEHLQAGSPEALARLVTQALGQSRAALRADLTGAESAAASLLQSRHLSADQATELTDILKRHHALVAPGG